MARGGQAGRARERQVAKRLRAQGWITMKGTSYGVADLCALKLGEIPMLIEVKSTAGGPYERFQPADRDELSAAAFAAGAVAVLAYWPPRGTLRLIPESEWPTKGKAHAARRDA
jgi:Holliday junction resolvase